MKKSEIQLLNQLRGGDNLETISGGNVNHGIGADASQIAGNPVFKAQFNLRFSQVYYDKTGAAVILPAALPAALQVSNPVYIFGNTDFSGAYKRARQSVPFVNGGAGFWNFLEAGIYGRDYFTEAVATVAPTAQKGDMVFISTATVAANVYLRVAIVSCPQIAYGSLLDAVQSDRFRINMVRYVVDTTLTSQLSNQIQILRQTLFGKTSEDNIDPQAYITGGTYNRNISDIPLEIGVDKNLILGLQMLYNVTTIDWIITVQSVRKLIEPV